MEVMARYRSDSVHASCSARSARSSHRSAILTREARSLMSEVPWATANHRVAKRLYSSDRPFAMSRAREPTLTLKRDERRGCSGNQSAKMIAVNANALFVPWRRARGQAEGKIPNLKRQFAI